MMTLIYYTLYVGLLLFYHYFIYLSNFCKFLWLFLVLGISADSLYPLYAELPAEVV